MYDTIKEAISGLDMYFPDGKYDDYYAAYRIMIHAARIIEAIDNHDIAEANEEIRDIKKAAQYIEKFVEEIVR